MREEQRLDTARGVNRAAVPQADNAPGPLSWQ